MVSRELWIQLVAVTDEETCGICLGSNGVNWILKYCCLHSCCNSGTVGGEVMAY